MKNPSDYQMRVYAYGFACLDASRLDIRTKPFKWLLDKEKEKEIRKKYGIRKGPPKVKCSDKDYIFPC